MKFSQRIGKTPISRILQMESIDSALRNSLWNVVKVNFIGFLKKNGSSRNHMYKKFASSLWHNFYKLTLESIPTEVKKTDQFIRERFLYYQWFEVYDFIEFIVNYDFNEYKKQEFITKINNILEREFSGYRIFQLKVVPISNNSELEELSNVINNTKSYTALEGTNIHLNKAVELISNKKNPNYSNSIKESISAVESTCRILTGEKTLGKALNKLEERGLKINGRLKSGFEKIYAYTNDKDNGIRHAIISEHIEPDFSDAKFMLISCSSFVNYLIDKALKSNIKFE